jgi:predicted enzyme related to lactoylglutathione lyase
MAGAYQIDYVELPSENGLASRRFFGEAFHWSFVEYGPSYLGIEAAGIDAGIQADPAERSGAPLIIVRTDDLEQARRDVELAGGVITRAPFDFPGGRRFHFREPGGCEMAVWAARPGG